MTESIIARASCWPTVPETQLWLFNYASISANHSSSAHRVGLANAAATAAPPHYSCPLRRREPVELTWTGSGRHYHARLAEVRLEQGEVAQIDAVVDVEVAAMPRA